MASKYVTDTAAAKSVSAYIVLNKKGQHVATVEAHFSNGGTCLVNIQDDKAGFQYGKAGGYGYDKFTAALRGLSIDGHALSDHCATEGQPKKPKGALLYPRDFKAPKGWTLANWTRVSRATGNNFYRDHWQTLALEKLGFPPRDHETCNLTDSEWASVARMANELHLEWEASDDCESGYTSCHRDSGLDYLRALGYRVIQAI